MLAKIAGFEFRYQLFTPLFVVVFSIFFLLTFGAVTSENISIGSTGAVHVNSPHAIAMIVLILSLFGTFIPTAFLASGVLRDAEYKTEEMFFSSPVKERDYLYGRFLGAFVVTLLVFSSVPLAVLIGSAMPWVNPDTVGPTLLSQYVYIYFVLGVANLFITGVILFTVANLTRSTMATYTALVVMLVLYFVGNDVGDNPELRDLVALFDPFGFTTYGEMTRYWTPFELNEKVVPLEGLMLQNRILWVGLGLGLLAFNGAVFSFRKKSRRKLFGRKEAIRSQEKPFVPSRIALPRVATQAGAGVEWQQFRARMSFEMKGIIKSTAFWILLALGMFNSIGAMLNPGMMFGTPVYPLTSFMIDTISGTFSLIPMIVVVYYASELVWKERSVGFSDIIDATPTPSWVFVFSKFLGMCLVLVGLFAASFGSAMVIQLFKGQTDLELSQYFLRLFVEFGIPFAMVAALSIFAQVLTNNRWLGMLVLVVYIVSTMALPNLGYEHNLYLFASNPSAPYSDMNGYGHLLGITLWFHLYWAFFSAFLLVMTFVLWNRGALASIWQRLRFLPHAFTPVTTAAALISLAGFGATGSFIYYNTNVLNEYVTARDTEKQTADYERKYRPLEDMVLPKTVDVSIDVDIFPSERRYEARGSYILENQTSEPIDTLMIGYGPGTDVIEHAMEGGTVTSVDEDFLVTMFALEPAMAPGEKRRFSFTVERNNPGFKNSLNVTTALYNGTFFNNGESMPSLGYQARASLVDPQARRRQDLPPVERAPKITDKDQWYVNALDPRSDHVSFRTTVSTSSDQIAIAPGKLLREWREGDRRYFEYQMQAPILNFYSWLSADYTVVEDQWEDVLLQIFYHEPHGVNVGRMMDGMKDSLAYFSEAFGPYQHSQARILEFPGYQSFAQSFPNTIPFSESIGFNADNSDPESIDYVYYVTAHEIAHQWWAHQVTPANVQGATMPSETFSQYSALMVMKKEYGEDHMRRFLKFELDRYLGDRGSEAIEEMPLWLVENQPYIHYRKGSLIMYALQDYLGEDRVNKVMAQLVAQQGMNTAPYTTTIHFLDLLRAEAGPEYDDLITDFFEKIVFLDLKVTEAKAVPLGDGTFEVTMDIEARKFEADGAGGQTEVPLDYRIDIGVFTKNLDKTFDGTDHVLFMEKRRIDTDRLQIKLIVDEEPKYVGIDPYNKLIDRNSDDNVKAVTLVSPEG
jgi:ABC-type transport system involved in multi-copper enzyme maturation permease subunit